MSDSGCKTYVLIIIKKKRIRLLTARNERRDNIAIKACSEQCESKCKLNTNDHHRARKIHCLWIRAVPTCVARKKERKEQDRRGTQEASCCLGEGNAIRFTHLVISYIIGTHTLNF